MTYVMLNETPFSKFILQLADFQFILNFLMDMVIKKVYVIINSSRNHYRVQI